jgi:hypothetical protein
MTVTATKIDSSHESGKNFITWAWPAWTTIIYNNPVVYDQQKRDEEWLWKTKLLETYSIASILN